MFGIEDFSKPIVDFSNFEFSQLGDALVFGGAILLIGVATVFAVLCVLWLFLILFRLVFNQAPAKKASKKNQATTVAQTENVANNISTNDTELIAVIAAAIAMAESENSELYPLKEYKIIDERNYLK